MRIKLSEMDKKVKYLYKTANKLNSLNKVYEAIDVYKQVLEYDKKHRKTLKELGDLYIKTNNLHKGIECYVSLYNLNPLLKDATTGVLLSEIATNYSKIKDFNNAIEYFKKIFNIKNNIPEVYNNIAICYINLRKYDMAKKNLFKSLNLRNDAAVNNILGEVFFYEKQYDKSIFHYEQNPNLKNDYTYLYNLSFPYLAKKDFKKGLELYENRLKKNEINSQTNQLERVNIPWVPDWKGEIIENMNLLVIYEQGIGDNIMYYRFIIELSNKHPNINITYFCKNTVFNMFNTYDKIKLINNLNFIDSNNTKYDFKVFIMSLPYYLNVTSIIPCSYNYIKINDEKDLYWKNNLPKNNKLNVGFFNNGLLSSFIEKSIPLECFETLTNLNINLISLHKTEEIEKDISSILFKDKLFTYNIDIDEPFIDTIAILNNIDLLLTIDTAIAHLAGVMNVKTYLLLGYSSDWRWFDTNEKIWYNSVDIIRMNENIALKNIIPTVEKLILNYTDQKEK